MLGFFWHLLFYLSNALKSNFGEITMGISPTQLLIILVIVALVFGTKKLRNMGGDIGGAVKGFKNAMRDGAGDEESPRLSKTRGEELVDSSINSSSIKTST